MEVIISLVLFYYLAWRILVFLLEYATHSQQRKAYKRAMQYQKSKQSKTLNQ